MEFAEAADAEPDAADHSPLIGRTAGEADPGPCAFKLPRAAAML